MGKKSYWAGFLISVIFLILFLTQDRLADGGEYPRPGRADLYPSPAAGQSLDYPYSGQTLGGPPPPDKSHPPGRVVYRHGHRLHGQLSAAGPGRGIYPGLSSGKPGPDQQDRLLCHHRGGKGLRRVYRHGHVSGGPLFDAFPGRPGLYFQPAKYQAGGAPEFYLLSFRPGDLAADVFP